jgi:hypothetical protein
VTVTLSFDRPKTAERGKLRTRLSAIRSSVTNASRALARPHTASLKRLADMPLTVVGTAGIDFAAFHLAHGWGWLVTGVSLLVVEQMIADEG